MVYHHAVSLMLAAVGTKANQSGFGISANFSTDSRSGETDFRNCLKDHEELKMLLRCIGCVDKNKAEGERIESSQDLEDSMSEELANLGMLEQGMTFQDKRDLLSVVRLSQKSAKDEEEERKTKTWSPHSQSNRMNSSNPTSVKGREQDNMSNKPKEIKIDHDEHTINREMLCNVTMTSSDDKKEEKTPRNKQFSAPALECNTTVRDLSTDLKVKFAQDNAPNSHIALSSKDSIVETLSGETEVLQNGCDNEVHFNECPGSDNENDIEINSVQIKQKDLNNSKREKDDRERNIDVFSHSSETNSPSFLRRNANKNQDRIPFYFVPKGMSLRKYVAYFKCCVNQYYKNFAVFQRSNIEHLDWGAPITMDTSSGFTNFRSKNADAHGDNTSKRYNFRDRYPKPKLLDFTSENSEDAEEEESNDEDIFTPRHKKLPGIKLSAKRKNTSLYDTMFTKKEKKENPQKKVQEERESLEDDEQDDNQFCDPSDKNIKNKGATSSRKRTRKAKIPILQSEISGSEVLQTQNETSEDIIEMDPSVSISSIMEPDIVIAEGPTIVSTQPQLDDITNQPSPLNVKQRRVQLKMKSNGRNRRKSEPRKNPDVVIVEEEIKPTPEEFVERVPCPICWQLFPTTDIEEHASECNQYNPENSSTSVKV